MHDELNAIRRLYDEAGTGGPPSDAAPVSAALADMKAALDALPPQRPDPAVIDAVVAAAGEAARAAALGPIRTVYDEDPEPLVSEAAEAEAAALAQVKTALDRLPRQRPEASVIDAVVAAAAQPVEAVPVAATVGRAADRPARPATRRSVVAALSAVFALVLVFGGGFWLTQDAAAPQEVAVAERSEAEESGVAAAPPVAEAPAEGSFEAAAPSAPTEASGQLAVAEPQRSAADLAPRDARQERALDAADEDVASARRAVPAPAPPAAANADGVMLASEAALPLADGDEELQLLYLRVREMQAAQAGLGWGTPPVSLGAVPDSTPAATGWMQVRVQR